LQGIVPTVELLARLNDKDQVLEYAEWVLEKNPDQAVRIFAERSKETADLIDATTVLGLLEKLGDAVIQTYLQFLIHKRANTSEEYHTKLAMAYTDQALAIKPGLESAEAMVVRKRLQDFLVSPICMTSFAKLLPKIQGTVMIAELILLYRGMGQHDKALDVRRTTARFRRQLFDYTSLTLRADNLNVVS